MLALLEALQDRPSATGPELAAKLGTDVRTLQARRRRPEGARHPRRGRARARRLVPAQARLPRPAADVHDRRGGRGHARADGRATPRAGGRPSALDKVRRVLPDRAAQRRRVARAAARLHGDDHARPAGRRDPARSSPTPPAATARSPRATPTSPAPRRDRTFTPVRRRRPQRPLVRPRLRRRPRRTARAASRPRQQASRSPAAASPRPTELRRRRVRRPHARARPVGARDRGRSCTTDPEHRRPPLPAHARRARRHHDDGTTLTHASRIARLGRRAAGRQRPRVHGHTARRAAGEPATGSPSGSRRPKAGVVHLVGRRLFHRVHRAEERAAVFAGVLDLLGGQLRAADGAGSRDGVVEGALFEVHAGTVARTRPEVSPINPAIRPVAAISQ